jgi:GntR family transcriptional repressor for pyruvate dehydrogenase complex
MAPSPIRPLAAERLPDRLAGAIREAIEARTFPDPTRLPTTEQLASDFGVSRNVVREAVARLEADGLVKTRHGSGVFIIQDAIAPFRLQVAEAADIDRVLELRLSIEVEAAALAAKRHDTNHRQVLTDLLNAMVGLTDLDERAALDRRFHRAIADASGNPLFGQFWRFLAQHWRGRAGPSRSEPSAAWLRATEREHEAIMVAIIARDEMAAAQAMRSHLQAGRVRLHSVFP